MPGTTAESRQLFEVLAAGDPNALKFLTPAGFEWRTATHHKSGYTALHVVINYGVVGGTRKHEDWLKVATWLLGQGADPTSFSGGHAPEMIFWQGDREVQKAHNKITAKVSQRSAIAVAVKVRAKMEDVEEDDCDWTDEIHFLTQLLAIYTSGSKTIQLERISVNAAVVERWDSIFHDTSNHDVVFETADGQCTAHSIVLSNASPVLKALFASSMLEGQNKRVQVKDVHTDAMNFFLELTYTGGGGDNVDAATAVAALEVAHRWQVNDVVAMLESFLSSLLTEGTFEEIARVAQVLQLSGLRSACVEFADSCCEIQEKAKSSQLHTAVMMLLGRFVPATAPQKRKRKRML